MLGLASNPKGDPVQDKMLCLASNPWGTQGEAAPPS